MSAADKREELEAAIWRAYPLPRVDAGPKHRERIEAALAAADEYAEAVADERIAGRVHDRTIGRDRLAELNAALRGAS